MKTTRKEVLEIIEELKTSDSIDVESLLKVCEDWLEMTHLTARHKEMICASLTYKIASMMELQVGHFDELIKEYQNLRNQFA